MIKIVIAEDQSMLRGALGTLLDFEEDLQVIGQVENGRQALEQIYSLHPDVCLLDIEMPYKNGLEVAETLNKENHPCKMIILTTFARPGYLERALNANVSGYLLKDGSSDELAEAIRNVMKGKKEYAPELIFGAMRNENPLTHWEQEILRLASEGKTTKEIAASLFLSNGTVRNYMSEIISKMHAKNRIEAISSAEEKGWI